ncbi:MAG: DEAD/DEAH box helicase [Spirochaetaceae bacterium]|jgi:ATP-dependent RNA helicase RhlB|nr:DEAD/DEAH box helicase [Spirochaetaceae bacterium]
MEFQSLELAEELKKALFEAGYVNAMPVQEKTIELGLDGRDLYVQSQTGTGKTAAFLIIIFHRLMTDPALKGRKALIMVPTRELAVQVEEEAKVLGRYLPFKTGSFYGGVGYSEQQKLLRADAQILVGTPGRVLDLNSSGEMNLMDIAFLVLDEADRMFDMGFYPDLRKLIKVVPPPERRQTMLFSATLNVYVKNLALEYTNNPLEIEIAPDTITVEEIDQFLYHVPSDKKFALLLGIMQREKPESAIIFCNTKRYTETVARRLRANGIMCEFISGDLPQKKRLTLIEDLKAGKYRYLAATDVAARGLDIEALALVVNYDLPAETENYVHRIGRTARAGANGKAISFASEQDVYELTDIERYIGKKIPAEIARDDLYADDASRGGQNEGRGRDRDRQNRGERTGCRQESDRRKESGRQHGGARQEHARQQRNTQREHGRQERGTRQEYLEQDGVRIAPVNMLAKMSIEERMAYYEQKYGTKVWKPEPRLGGSARTEKKKNNRRKNGRSGGRPPHAAAASTSRSGTGSPPAASAPSTSRSATKGAGTQTKKGVFAHIAAFFSKDKS